MERDSHKGTPDNLPAFLDIDRFLQWEKLRLRALNRTNPLPWRTLVVETRAILGASDPDHSLLPPGKFEEAKKVVNTLIEGTYYQELSPDIMLALGGPNYLENYNHPPLDVVIFNTRRDGEPFLPYLAEELLRRNKRIAALQTVGDRFKDHQMRILAPQEFVQKVNRAVIISSTQEMYGGEMYPLAMGLRLIRNDNYRDIMRVDIVIPMFGGSRGDKSTGQDYYVGYEILEAVGNPKLLAVPLDDILRQLRVDFGGESHKVIRIITPDVHGAIYPGEVFRKEGLGFISVSPQAEFAEAHMTDLRINYLLSYPIRIIACDNGDINRMQDHAANILYHPDNHNRSVELLYIEKKRGSNNKIISTDITGLVRWKLDQANRVTEELLPIPTIGKPCAEECTIYIGDDMIDTGGTMGDDVRLVESIHTGIKRLTVGATHPVFSEGVDSALGKIRADKYFLGNTLNPDGLNRNDVVIVDVAPAVVDTLLSS